MNGVFGPREQLEQGEISGDSSAEMRDGLLGLHRSGQDDPSSGRWEVGLLKGAKHSSHVVMRAGNGLTLELAGHSVALAEVLALENGAFSVDKRALARLVDPPVPGARDVESAAQRREPLNKRVQALTAQGVRQFLTHVPEAECITVSRLKPTPQDDATRLRAAGVAQVYTPKDFELNTIMRDIITLADPAAVAAE